MKETKSPLLDRSYQFALQVVKFTARSSYHPTKNILLRQLVKSATSIGANIEEANGAQTRKDFIAKLHISYKEARETLYWLRLLQDSELADKEEIEKLKTLGSEILYILTRSLKTAKKQL